MQLIPPTSQVPQWALPNTMVIGGLKHESSSGTGVLLPQFIPHNQASLIISITH